VTGMEAKGDMFTSSWGLRGLYHHMMLHIITLMLMPTRS